VSGQALAGELQLLRPEAALAGGLCLLLAADLSPQLRARAVAPWLGVLACAAAAGLALTGGHGSVAAMLAIDPLAAFARLPILLVTALVLLAGAGERRREADHGAWSCSVLGIGLGAMLVAAAANFVSLWLGLELIALASYVLAAFRGGDRRAAEAGMKFVLFGGAASALTLFGMSHVYGLTGHLDFAGVGQALGSEMPVAVLAALCLAGVGIAYKLTLVPFHFYAPDVYQGAPALSVAAVAAVPKIAAVAALVRLLQSAVPASLAPAPALGNVLAGAAAVSMLVAAFTAVVQQDGKRIVAFSGIGHGGALVLALACLPGAGAIATAGFYLLGYAAANVGALVCLSVLERTRGDCSLGALAGAVRQQPWVTAALCLFLFSLAGVPPLAGFLGKWAVLQQALAQAQASGGAPLLPWAVLALLLSTAVSAWAYLLVVRAAVLAPAAAATATPPRLPWPTAVVLLACTAATLGLGVWLDGLPAIQRALLP